jgi:hypothetical protein
LSILEVEVNGDGEDGDDGDDNGEQSSEDNGEGSETAEGWDDLLIEDEDDGMLTAGMDTELDSD